MCRPFEDGKVRTGFANFSTLNTMSGGRRQIKVWRNLDLVCHELTLLHILQEHTRITHERNDQSVAAAGRRHE